MAWLGRTHVAVLCKSRQVSQVRQSDQLAFTTRCQRCFRRRIARSPPCPSVRPSSWGCSTCTAGKERARARSRMTFVATQETAFINSAPHPTRSLARHCRRRHLPSRNQCVLILTTAPRHRLYKFLLFFIISLSCSWHTDCPMLPSAPHKRTNTIIAGLSVCLSVGLLVGRPA